MESLLVIFLLLGPILDVTSFYNLPINILVRGIYLLSIIFLMIKRKKNLKLLIALLIFSIIEIVFQRCYLDFSLRDTFSNTFKYLYLTVSILYFKDFEFKKYSKEKILTTIILSYIGIYLFSYITKIGESAYLDTDGKSGFKGLFSSINEFSAILIGLLPIVVIYLKNKKNYGLLLLVLLGTLMCSLLVGTKVLLAGFIFTVFYLLYKNKDKLFTCKTRRQKQYIIIVGILILLVSCFLFTKTRIYENMVIQKSFFKADNILSYDYFNHVIFNDRLSFLTNNFNYFKNTNILNILFGIGINNYDVKMVEIDIFDIIFRYGLIGILLFGYVMSIINFKELKEEEKISLILLLIISLTSGHVLFYPNVCIYIALLTTKSVVK